MICKKCNQDKVKEPIIRGTITRFVDEFNRLWNGKVCPDCYKEYNKNRMKESRAKSKDSTTLPRDIE